MVGGTVIDEAHLDFNCCWLVVIILQGDVTVNTLYIFAVIIYYAPQSLVMLLAVLIVHHYSYWTVSWIICLTLDLKQPNCTGYTLA